MQITRRQIGQSTIIVLGIVAQLPNGGDFYFTAYQQDSNGDLDESTAKEFVGTPNKALGRIENVRHTAGQDTELPSGSWIVASPTAAWVNNASDEVQALSLIHI